MLTITPFIHIIINIKLINLTICIRITVSIVHDHIPVMLAIYNYTVAIIIMTCSYQSSSFSAWDSNSSHISMFGGVDIGDIPK